MRLPIDAELLPNGDPEDDCDCDDVDLIINSLLISRANLFASANENIKNAQRKQKEVYDRKHLQQELPEGAEVLLENTKQKQRKGGKYDPVWLGPYLINKSFGKGVYSLKKRNGDLLKSMANIDRLKLFVRRDDKV